ncbi:MAG: polysaccharide deacetylase family protein [Flavobacteriales bacterium]|nr:polysaccharide deacetylase family protein [Flavobacteriales bacterium]
MLNYRSTIVAVAIMLVATSYGFYTFNISVWWGLIPFGFYFLMVGLGSYKIGMKFYIDSICDVPNSENKVAITFDDGPNIEFTPRVLNLLDEHNAKATFFCIGTTIEKHPEMLKEIDKRGHTVGNHSYSHDIKFDMSSVKDVKQDLQKTEALIETQIGKKTLLFRPPFGVTNPKIAKAVKQLKLQSIGWNIRTLDTTKDSEDKIFDRTTNIKAGDIVLLHDTSDKSVKVLARLLKLLGEKGLHSVTIDELTNIKGYA